MKNQILFFEMSSAETFIQIVISVNMNKTHLKYLTIKFANSEKQLLQTGRCLPLYVKTLYLTEVLLTSTLNICFHGEKKKNMNNFWL